MYALFRYFISSQVPHLQARLRGPRGLGPRQPRRGAARGGVRAWALRAVLEAPVPEYGFDENIY